MYVQVLIFQPVFAYATRQPRCIDSLFVQWEKVKLQHLHGIGFTTADSTTPPDMSFIVLIYVSNIQLEDMWFPVVHLSRCPNHLSLLLSVRRRCGSTPSFLGGLTLTPRLSPATLLWKLLLATCVCSLILSVSTKSS